MLTNTRPGSKPGPEITVLFASIVSALAAWLIWGFRTGYVNNEFHFPILLVHRHEAIFRGDAMAGTLSHFASPLWLALGAIPAIVPLKTILLACFLLSRVLLAWSVGLLVSAFVPESHRRTARIVGAVSTICSGWISTLPLGADPVFGTYFSQTFLSVPLLIAALAYQLHGSRKTAAIFLGLGYDVNLMQANFVAGILVCGWLFENGLPSIRSIRSAAAHLALVVAAGLPGFALAASALASKSTAPVLDASALSDFAAFHIPGHFFWTIKSSSIRLQAIGLALAPLAMMAIGDKKRLTLLWPACVLPIAYMITETFLIQAAPSRFLFQLHLFRSDVFSYTLGAAIAIGFTVRSVSQGDFRRTGFWIATASMLLLQHGFSALALCIAWWIVERWPVFNARLGALAIGILSLYVEKSVGAPASQLMILALALSLLMFQEFISKELRSARFATICLFPVLVVFVGYRFWSIDLHPADENVRGLRLHNYEIALDSARRTTSDTALFTVPPSFNTRPLLQRGVYYSIWDGAGFLWSKGHEREVLRRMSVLGISYTPGKQYQSDSIDHQWAYGVCASGEKLRKEGVDHAILPVTNGRIDIDSKLFVVASIDSASLAGFCPVTASPR